jgi:hypothetical protein
MHLYTVITSVPDYARSENIEYRWFRDGPELPLPSSELISSYDPGDTDAADAIRGFFTKSEAIALKRYLDRNFAQAGNTIIREVKLPVPEKPRVGANVAVGAGIGFHRLSDAPDFMLPFGVSGYFRHSRRAPAGGSCSHARTASPIVAGASA